MITPISVRAQDELGALFEATNANLVRWFAVRTDGDDDLAQDLAMKVWVRCSAARSRGQQVFWSYIWDRQHGAAVSVLKDHYRAMKRKPRPISLDAWLAERERRDDRGDELESTG